MSQEGYSGAKVLECKMSKTRDEKNGKFMIGKKREGETQSADSDWMDKMKQGVEYDWYPPVIHN